MEYNYISQKNIDLSKLNNLELNSFFSEMKQLDNKNKNNNEYLNFVKVSQYTFTQEKINEIDSWTWRQIINKYPQLSMWCNIDKLDISDISNLCMKYKDLLISSKYSKNSITFFKDFKLFKIELKETKDQFKVKLVPYFEYFDYAEIIHHIIFKDKTINELGFSFDLSGLSELEFSLNKNGIIKPKDQLLIAFNNIIKNNLFNFTKLI